MEKTLIKKEETQSTELENVINRLNQLNIDNNHLINRLSIAMERLKSTSNEKTCNAEKAEKEPYDLIERLDYGLNSYTSQNSRLGNLLNKLETLI